MGTGSRMMIGPLGATIGLLLVSAAAAAEDAPAPAPTEVERLKAETDKKNAEAALVNAQAALLKAQTDALGLPDTEGKTTLEEHAGELEGWMLASGAINKAAEEIAGDLSESPGIAVGAPYADDGSKSEANGAAHKESGILLLDSDDILDLAGANVIPRGIRAINGAALAQLPAECKSQPPKFPNAALSASVTTAIGAALSLLRTDTTISGFALGSADGALINAIASKAPPDGSAWVIPGELAMVDEQSEIVKLFDALLDTREAARTCRINIASNATTDAAKKKVAPKLATLDALVERIDAYVTQITTAKEGGASPLAAAVIASTLRTKYSNMRVLRVKVEKGGGSLLKRANLWTSLGAPAIGITGGLVTSWRLTNPATGAVETAGLLVCRTALTNLRSIHAGKAGASACQPVVKDASSKRS